MSIRTALLSALVALGAVACAKPSDVPKLQEEATATIARYSAEVTEVDDRADRVRAAGERISSSVPGADQMQTKFKTTGEPLGELHRKIESAPKDIADAAKQPDPVAALHAYIDNTNHHFEDELRKVVATIETAEAWQAQQGQVAAAAPPAPVPTNAPTPVDPTAAP